MATGTLECGVNELPGPPLVVVDRTEPLGLAASIVDEARARETTARIWITGPQGIGKSTLALDLAHGLLGGYGELRLFYELGGSTPGGPADPAEVLAHWLRGLGCADDRIPAREAERLAMFRSLTVGRRVLMLLDDAHDGAQVERLLPSAPDSVVVVTSRQRHERLFTLGFRPVELGPFADEHAIELLSALVPGDLVAAEPEAVRALAGICGGVPLALSVASVRLRRYRKRPFAFLVDLLRERSPLEALHLDGERVVGIMLDVSAGDLSGPARRAYRLLGLHPGPHFATEVAFALLGDADEVLDELCTANLLVPAGEDRYRFAHALIAAHAHACALAEEDAPSRHAALQTMIRWYAEYAAGLALSLSGRWWVGEAFARVAPARTGPDARRLARADLATEHLNLRAAMCTAAEAGLDPECALLSEALWPLYYDTDRDADLLEATRCGVAAAGRLDDPALRMRLHHDRGAAAEKAGLFDEALDAFGLARRFADEADHPSGAQSAAEWQGIVLAQLGRVGDGLDRLRESWRIAEERVPDPARRDRMLALLRLHMSRLLVDASRPEEAHPLLTEAYTWFRERGEQINTARAAQTLARVLMSAGRHDEATIAADEAAALFTDAGLRSAAVRTAREMAAAAETAGLAAEARGWHRRAEDLAGE